MTSLSTFKIQIKNLFERIRFFIFRPPEFYKHKKLVRIFELKGLYDLIPEDGDIVECGVGTGSSLFVLAALAKEEGKNRVVWGFDSFEGFPEPSPEDASIRGTQKGEWGFATLNRIKMRMGKIQAHNINLVKGYFENTTTDFIHPIALLHIDVDLYQSYKTVLDNLFKNVVSGGVVAFDEYGSKKWPGATRAIDEFLHGKNYTLQKMHNKYFIIKE